MSRNCSGLARWRNRRRLDAAFLGTLGSSGMKALRAHAGGCADCRSIYDRLGLVDRTLGGGAAVENIGQALAITEDRERRRRRWAIFLGVDAVAIAVALLFFLRPRPEPDRFRARGGGGPRQPGVTLYCVEGGRVTASISALAAPLAAPVLTCKLADGLQVAYTTPSDTSGLRMIVTGVDADGERHWYVPRKPDDAPLPLTSGAADQTVPWSTALAVKHRPGRVTLRIKLVRGEGSAGTLDTAPAELELAAILEISP